MKYKFILISVIIPFLFECHEKEPYAREFSIINTLAVTDINSSAATFNGEIIKRGTTHATISYGFVWDWWFTKPWISEQEGLSASPYKSVQIINSSTFTLRIDNLLKGKKYYVRAYAISNNTITYGNIISFICN